MKNIQISFFTAFSIVVANMVGTGVFTSLGFQLVDIQSVFSIMLLWLLGGISALCGALSYGELGASMPRSGGEYHFLSEIFHPSLGFVSGWVSATVGFAAPVALVCMTFGEYVNSVFPSASPKFLATSLLFVVTSIHIKGVKSGSRFQGFFTILKIILIIGFVFAAFLMVDPQQLSLIPSPDEADTILSSPFAVSLIYVSYAYTGWNAATYLIGELENPQKDLPKALLWGTAVVTLLYMLLNYAFLLAAPMEELAGKVEVGYVAAIHIFGPQGGRWMAVVLALLLISTVSAMTFAGPRVLVTIGEDYPIFKFLSSRNKEQSPVRAIIFQASLSLLFIATGSFEKILIFAGFVLASMTFLTVLGLFVLRIRKPYLLKPYKVWGYPFTPAIYLLLVGYNLAYLLKEEFYTSLWGILIIGLGLLIYYLSKLFQINK